MSPPDGVILLWMRLLPTTQLINNTSPYERVDSDEKNHGNCCQYDSFNEENDNEETVDKNTSVRELALAEIVDTAFDQNMMQTILISSNEEANDAEETYSEFTDGRKMSDHDIATYVEETICPLIQVDDIPVDDNN